MIIYNSLSHSIYQRIINKLKYVPHFEKVDINVKGYVDINVKGYVEINDMLTLVLREKYADINREEYVDKIGKDMLT